MHATYTEYLRDLMNEPYTKSMIDKALSTYPIYSPEKLYDLIPNRSELNQRILNHYKYREIGFETVGRFLDELEITMCEIMPRYNELFKTVEIMAELPSPFDNVDVVETFEQESTSNQSATASSSNSSEGEQNTSGSSDTTSGSNSKTVHSETPSDDLGVTASDIQNVSYADDIEWSRGEGNENVNTSQETSHNESSEATSESSARGSGTVKHTLTKKGNQGVNTYAHDMNEFRTSIIDVVDQIVNDPRLNELFMCVF